MEYLDTTRVTITYEIPLSEIVYDFFDQLKSGTKGYASLDYELSGYRQSNLAKMDIVLNGEQVDALSFIVHRDRAYNRGRIVCEKLREPDSTTNVRGANSGICRYQGRCS